MPVERLAEYLAVLREIPARHGVEVVVFGHAGDGHLHVNLLPDTTRPGWEKTVRAIFDEVTRGADRDGWDDLRENMATGGFAPSMLERVIRRGIVVNCSVPLKHAFDPGGPSQSGCHPGVASRGPESREGA